MPPEDRDLKSWGCPFVLCMEPQGTSRTGLEVCVWKVRDISDPEYFMFATDVNPDDYLRGVLRATQMIMADLGQAEKELEHPDVVALSND